MNPTTGNTIGNKAKETANKYFQIYKRMSEGELADRAENLALHDLVQDKLVAEFAIEELKELIANDKKKVEQPKKTNVIIV